MRVFSGIKPTGEMHIGNYIGAVRRWVAEQEKGEAIYCVVDLHAMTIQYDVKEFRRLSRRLTTLLLACGLDPEKCIYFVQSHVPEHTELSWILNCVATFGELRRQTQFKSKAEGQESVSVGLFDYPVLMVADILLYNTTQVPVGEDQKQHVELARDVAIRFNQRFGETFVVPEPVLPTVGARVRDLQNPAAKMSKSEESPMGTVLIFDEPAKIKKKFKSAVTDSETSVRYDPENKPGVSNMLEIFSVATGKTVQEAEDHFAGGGYGALKSQLADAVIEMLRPIQERYRELEANPDEVDRLMALGAERARDIARPAMERVRHAVGLTRRSL
jgi:tryptophanyl-tRNA synthetase